ncbi:hypothetical protein [Vibrio genomosp. F10]|uniref:hypothetical protein n=1 Tax=Vibrio genomosp. F10 TaxID=723171 RepID=UPI00030A46B3|nr:hypothetical protein [Vibrio genomosp. F10]OEE89914.1 hypothetical protein A1QK_18620 [Vibrio genomosp. F10 str. 9ZD137]
MDTITKVLAIWGAVVSTFALLWNIKNSLSDRALLKIVADRGYITRDKLKNSKERSHQAILRNLSPDDEVAERLKVYVYNIGKRPIVISGFEVRYSKSSGKLFHKLKKSLIMSGDFPQKLDAGDFLLFEYGWHVVDENFSGVQVTTADNKKYSLPKKNTNMLKQLSKSKIKVHMLRKKPEEKKVA